MKKRLYFSFLSALFVLLSFPVWAQPSAVTLKPLDNYFLDNKVPLNKGINCMVITSEKQFYKLFGIAKTANNAIKTPDFNKEMVLLLAIPASKKETIIQFETATKAGDFIEVYFSSRKGYSLTYTTQSLALAVIPKYSEVNTIRFYTKSKMVKEVKVEKRK